MKRMKQMNEINGWKWMEMNRNAWMKCMHEIKEQNEWIKWMNEQNEWIRWII